MIIDLTKYCSIISWRGMGKEGRGDGHLREKNINEMFINYGLWLKSEQNSVQGWLNEK